MVDSVRGRRGQLRALAIGGGTLLSIATLFPLSVSAGFSAATPTITGTLANTARTLTAGALSPGDYVSSGWGISMIGQHPEATVRLTRMLAIVPLACQWDDRHQMVAEQSISFPDATVSFPANDTSWHPTASTSDARGYQAAGVVDHLCRGGAVAAVGPTTFLARLVSTDTSDLFAMRFHAVDGRANAVRGSHAKPNTDCSSAKSNPSGATQCNAAWSRPSTSRAAAPPKDPGGDGRGQGPGDGGHRPDPGGDGRGQGPGDGGHRPDPGTGNGTGPGVGTRVPGVVTGTVTGSLPSRIRTISPIPILARAFRLAPAHGTTGLATSQATAAPGQPGGVAAQGAPALMPPAPSHSSVLGPVPLPVPVIDSVAAGVAGSLPWKWFALLALIDLGLIGGVVLRRRNAQHDRLRQR